MRPILYLDLVTLDVQVFDLLWSCFRSLIVLWLLLSTLSFVPE